MSSLYSSNWSVSLIHEVDSVGAGWISTTHMEGSAFRMNGFSITSVLIPTILPLSGECRS